MRYTLDMSDQLKTIKFYKFGAILIILIAILLSGAFGILLPFKTHPYFYVVATLYVIGTIVLIVAALVCLKTLHTTYPDE